MIDTRDGMDNFNQRYRSVKPCVEACLLLLFSCWIMLNSFAFGNDGGYELVVDKALSSKDLAQFRKERALVTLIRVKQGSSGNVFKLLGKMPRLRDVNLNADAQVNNECLKDLVRIYPNLDSLSINQIEPLSVDSMSLLASFHDLQTLSLTSKLADSSSFKNFVPATITELLLPGPDAENLELPKLPKLRLLVLEGPVGASFFQKIDSPLLEELNIKFGISHEAVKELARFKHLKFLFMSRGSLSHDDYRTLLNMGLKEITYKQH